MASKKREVQLQSVINSQSLWDEMLLNKGLTVIDVYQAWCGPCKAVQTLFRKLKNELNEDEILHFAVAEADNIVTLQAFRDKCEPVFLFSLNGKIIAKIQGANAPLINKKVISLINEERKVIAGEIARPQVILKLNFIFPLGESYSIAIIKPEAILRRKYQGIKESIIKIGFVIEEETKKILTEEEVRDFYSKVADQPDFEEFVSFMTSCLSCVLIISQGEEPLSDEKETDTQPVVESERLSEQQVENDIEAKLGMAKKKRDSLQEYLERQHISQFCDVEENPIYVTKFIDIFFPDFKTRGIKLVQTLALLRPNVSAERKDDVLNIINNEGFEILMERQVVLSEEEARSVCKEYENEDYFKELIEYMISSSSLVLVLLREDGLEHWKELLGPRTVEEASNYDPKSLCAQFAMGSLPINQLYGSSSTKIAEKEIEHFFPPESTLALIKPHVTHKERGEILDHIKEARFDLTQMREMVLTPEYAIKIYFKISDKPFYKNVLEVLAEGPSLVMVLTKWKAIAEWRRMMGPVDPEEAKLLSPDSIRAKYGINILKNAAHGASDLYEASSSINNMFAEDESEN
uniref:Thioredoxin domain-containing protein 3 n=1 Tax=Jaculus jaculus TaxID=51337 RepID=A0A8C5JVF7_JACJA